MDYLPYLYYIGRVKEYRILHSSLFVLHSSLSYSHSIVEGGFEEIS